MEFFDRANVVRLRSSWNKYLVACPDQKSVRQSSDGSSENARWTVEIVEEVKVPNVRLRLKSCHGLYLTATDIPTHFNKTSCKVLQTTLSHLDAEVEWKPLRCGAHVLMKSCYGFFLCAKRGFFQPWRGNSVSHCVFHQYGCGFVDSISFLWEVDVVAMMEEPLPKLLQIAGDPILSGWLEGGSSSGSEEFPFDPSSSTRVRKVRRIYYAVGNDDGEVDDNTEEPFIVFKGTRIERLQRKLEEATGLDDIVVCFCEPVSNKLCPLLLPLPPGTSPRHVILIRSSSSAAKGFAKGKYPYQKMY